MNYLGPSRTPDPANVRSTPWGGRALAALLSALPQACELCGGFAGRRAVCAACEESLPRLPGMHCPVCSDRSDSGDVCGRCLAHPPAYARVVSAFSYAHPIDELVQALKYGHRLHLAEWFGQALAEAWLRDDEARCDRGPLIIAMPMHPDRLTDRGFNQATEIARPLARRLGVPLDHGACTRVRATAPQARLDASGRAGNVRDAFECRIDLTGRTAILVDDVMTSGASIGELARTVRLHGAARVLVAVAARTLHG